jgi:hypothetical protein
VIVHPQDPRRSKQRHVTTLIGVYAPKGKKTVIMLMGKKIFAVLQKRPKKWIKVSLK